VIGRKGRSTLGVDGVDGSLDQRAIERRRREDRLRVVVQQECRAFGARRLDG
jgi:hypothetical protein